MDLRRISCEVYTIYIKKKKSEFNKKENIRFCQELGYHKEETQSTPIVGKDGSVDAFEMAMRRRIYWSCLILDK